VEMEIHAADELQAVHSALMFAVDNGFKFVPGSAGLILAIDSIADAGGGEITVELDGAHNNLVAGDIVGHTGLGVAAYDGFHEVTEIINTTSYKIAAVFSATASGFMDAPSGLRLNSGFDGPFSGGYHGTGESLNNNRTFEFVLMKNTTPVPFTACMPTFGGGGSSNLFDGRREGGLTLAAGDFVFVAVMHIGGTSNILLSHMNMGFTRT